MSDEGKRLDPESEPETKVRNCARWRRGDGQREGSAPQWRVSGGLRKWARDWVKIEGASGAGEQANQVSGEAGNASPGSAPTPPRHRPKMSSGRMGHRPGRPLSLRFPGGASPRKARASRPSHPRPLHLRTQAPSPRPRVLSERWDGRAAG